MVTKLRLDGGIAHDVRICLDRLETVVEGQTKISRICCSVLSGAGVMTSNEGKIYKDMELFRQSKLFRSD